MSEDPQLEVFLRRFRPSPPPPLVRRRAAVRRWVVAAAAAVGIVWLLLPVEPPRRGARSTAALRPTVGALNAALRAGRHEETLDRLSERLLPDPLRAGGALRIIGEPGWDR